MTKEQPQYLILKLRSGDEIIGKRNGTKKGFVLLHRPLQLHRSTLLDPTTGAVRKNICMLRDWLEFTTQIECEIPEDYIVISNPPSPDMIEKYVQELVSFDVDAPQPVVAPIATTPPKATPRKAPLPPPALTDDMLDDFFKNILQQKPNSPSAPPAAPFMGGFASTPIPPSPAPVTVSFTMPPEVFYNIIFNLPFFDGFGQDMPDSEDDDSGDSGDDGGEEDPPQTPRPPQSRRKPKKDDDAPPWNGRFGFPK